MYKTRMLILEVLESNSARKGNKSYKLETEVKLSLFANDMILSIENPKESTKQAIDQMSHSQRQAAAAGTLLLAVETGAAVRSREEAGR